VCAQITEAYILMQALSTMTSKLDKILLKTTKTKPHKAENTSTVLVDFSKAIKISNARCYTLSELHQANYGSHAINF